MSCKYSSIFIWPEDEQMTNEADVLRASWRVLQDQWPQLEAIITSPRKYKIVVDANMLLADLRYKFLNPDKHTLLETLYYNEMIEILAPHWLVSELRCGSAISEFISNSPTLKEADLWSQWPTLQKIIKFDRRYDYPLRSKLVGIKDIKDEPYVATMRAHGAIGILSRDKGFRNLKLKHMHRNDLMIIETLSELLERTFGAKLIIVGGPVGLTFGSVAAANWAYKRVISSSNEVKIAVGGACVVAGLLCLYPKSRRYLMSKSSKLENVIQPIWKGYQKIAIESFDMDNRIDELILNIEEGRVA